MVVRELIDLLSKCDPEGTVSFSLPCDVVDGTEYADGISYVYVPLVQALWSTEAMQAGRLADRVSFEIPSLNKRDK
ncbi:hypothetical protein [Pseudoduganella violacea]|uniref:Uncharacterized protein n=1 Tax=Pseudoduganella violacea TaxID=1715466 RepID=A0A7W5BFG6_9BURK|nr:hypothetical protein [Pseudoduganella violacea]MBB3122159.1 hypothetical protein [Pseudoduganella violacea]